MAGLSPDLVDETFFFPRLQSLVECLREELESARGPQLCYCGLWVSTAAPTGLMSCSGGEGCGVAWVRPVTAYPSDSFPEPTGGVETSCASPMVMQVEIGVARCYPRPQGRDVIVDPQQMFDATRLYMSDMRAAKRALICCLPGRAPGGEVYQTALDSWNPLDPTGGVSGGAWSGWIG